jgi:hypothetical protein
MNTSNTKTKLLIGASMLTAVLGLTACGENYSNGDRAGIVTKLSQKGLVFKSWEGEMLVALPAEIAGTTQPEKFAFNVSPEAVDKVKTAMASGKRVTLVYRQWAIAPITVEHEHVIVDVKP